MPNDETIRKCADELTVDFEDLKKFVLENGVKEVRENEIVTCKTVSEAFRKSSYNRYRNQEVVISGYYAGVRNDINGNLFLELGSTVYDLEFRKYVGCDLRVYLKKPSMYDKLNYDIGDYIVLKGYLTYDIRTELRNAEIVEVVGNSSLL